MTVGVAVGVTLGVTLGVTMGAVGEAAPGRDEDAMALTIRAECLNGGLHGLHSCTPFSRLLARYCQRLLARLADTEARQLQGMGLPCLPSTAADDGIEVVLGVAGGLWDIAMDRVDE